MAAGTTHYTARFPLPDLLEGGSDQVVRCEVYRNGQLVAPSAGSVTLYDPANVSKSTPAVTIVGGVATATVLGTAHASSGYGSGWRIEWSLTFPDGVYLFRNDASIVHYRLYPVISDLDVARRLRALSVDLPGSLTTRLNHQDAIDEADVELQLRLIEKGRRPWLIATPSSLRQCWLYLAIAVELESLAVQNQALRQAAQDWRAKYEDAWVKASVQLDYDQDGVVDANTRQSVARAGVWLC